MTAVKPAYPQFQRGHPLAQGLVAGWPFTEGNTDSAAHGTLNLHDAVTGAYNAPFNGFTTWVGTPFGFATVTNGTTFATVPVFPQLPIVSYFSWLKRDSLTTGDVAAHWTTSVGDWTFYFDAGNKLTIDIPFVLGSVAQSTSAISDTTTYHHVGFTRSGSTGAWTYKFYIDGRLDNTVTGVTTNPGGAADNFHIGGGANGIGAFNIVDALIYNRAVSAAEAASLYADSFVMYRKPEHAWEAQIVAAPTFHPGPGFPLGLAMGGAALDALRRNPILTRRRLITGQE